MCIRDSRIRCVGRPADRFEEDALRILRALRLDVYKRQQLCTSKAHYLASRLDEVPGFELAYPKAEFFHEFVTRTPVEPQRLLKALEEQDILGGLPVEDGLLWCVTEKTTKEQIDRLVEIAQDVARACT